MDAIQSFLSSLLAPATLLAIAAFLFVLWRTRSLHVVVVRCWSVMAGSTELVDNNIKRYGNDLHSLSYFQVLTGLRVRSLRDADRLICWAHDHHIDLRDVGWCGNYFDREKLSVRSEDLPKKGWRKVLVMAVGAHFAISLMFLAFFMSSSKAYLKFTDSGSYFTISRQEAKRWRWPLSNAAMETIPLTRSVCKNDINDQQLVAAGFSRGEAYDICNVLTADDSKMQVAVLIGDQRRDSLMLFLIFMILLLPPGLWLRRIIVALSVSGKLPQPYGKGIACGSGRLPGLRRASIRASIAERRKLHLSRATSKVKTSNVVNDSNERPIGMIVLPRTRRCRSIGR